MIYHVLPGDSLVTEFKRSGIAGEMIVCREALVAGPIDADTLDEFWQQRARFVLAEYAEDEIVYHETVAEELAKLLDTDEGDEVNLWFEYELFCSVNMWFCLSLLQNSDAVVYRVEPIGLDEPKRWDGFGKFTGDELLAAFELRTRLEEKDKEVGAELWQAYSRDDQTRLKELSQTESPAFPYVREVVAAAIEQDIRPLEVLREITSSGETDFGKIFVEFRQRAGVYGYGDDQVHRLLDQLSL